MKTIEMSELEADVRGFFSRLEAEGEAVQIVQGGRLRARIEPPAQNLGDSFEEADADDPEPPFLDPHSRTPGNLKGKVIIVGDVVSPLPPEWYGSLAP